jgi:hypothetical protein
MTPNPSKPLLLERLKIAAHTAPILRGGARSRQIKVVDRDGTLVREIDSAVLTLKLHERAGIEFDVEPGRREQVRTCKCGFVFLLPPKRDWKSHPGRLPKRCPSCRKASRYCKVCGAASTAASQRRGDPQRAYCKAHVPSGAGCERPVPACVVCGAPAHSSPAKARFAASKGRSVYCETHRGGVSPASPEPRTCEVCAVTIKGARWCSAHRGTWQAKPRPPCAVCGKPSQKGTHRTGRSLPYCEEHKGGTGRGQFKKGQNKNPAKRKGAR